MDSITRGTTRYLRVRLPQGVETSDIAAMWLTFVQKGRELFTKYLSDMEADDGAFVVHLTQADTLKLARCCADELVYIQARARTTTGDAIATKKDFAVKIEDIWKDGEI